MKRLVLYLSLLSLFLVPLAAGGETAGGELSTVLAGLERAASGVKALASDFVQEKHLEMFREPLLSKGRFSFQSPDKLRWELTEPVASGFVLHGERGRRWHERTGGTEDFDIAREPAMKLIADQLFAWARIDLDWLGRHYRMSLLEKEPVSLKLVPLAAGAENYLDHLRIVFAADKRHVAVVEVFEGDGDFTRIRFLDAVVNGPPEEGLF